MKTISIIVLMILNMDVAYAGDSGPTETLFTKIEADLAAKGQGHRVDQVVRQQQGTTAVYATSSNRGTWVSRPNPNEGANN